VNLTKKGVNLKFPKNNSIAKQGEQSQANQNQVRSRKIYAAKKFI
jgi:hypothetical protein